MSTLWMLIGVPASGKSSWLAKQSWDWSRTQLLSTDAIIDREASAQGKTYGEVFSSVIKQATAEMNANLRRAVKHDMDIVWDQTNLSVKARAGKLAQIPDHYHKIAVFFLTPSDAELRRRLASRPGKTIPANVIMGMKSQLEMPTKSEGFDQVIVVS
jgi:predicted kinase